MGTDLIEGLHLWDNEGDRLINGVKFLIFERPGYD
jgi:nicotinic acid mononucleotide adenylyltransferase